MTVNEDIDELLKTGISIFQKEIETLSNTVEPLSKQETDKLVELIKTLVIVRKDWRVQVKEEILDVKALSEEELEAAILLEAEKIKAK